MKPTARRKDEKRTIATRRRELKIRVKIQWRLFIFTMLLKTQPSNLSTRPGRSLLSGPFTNLLPSVRRSSSSLSLPLRHKPCTLDEWRIYREIRKRETRRTFSRCIHADGNGWIIQKLPTVVRNAVSRRARPRFSTLLDEAHSRFPNVALATSSSTAWFPFLHAP